MSDEAPQGADVQWIEVRFRDETVHARATPDGRVLTRPDGFVDFVYKLGGKAYKTRPDRLITVAGAAPKAAPAAAPRPAAKRASRGQAGTRSVLKMGAMRSADTAIMMWTDGACTGNPGPAGAGVYCEHQGTVRELSEYLGQGTNNIAELTAILRALEMVEDPTQPVDILSDSDYSLKVVSGIYKAKKNRELIDTIKAALVPFTDLQLVKVPGHAGVDGNERADELAREAIVSRGTRRS